MKTTDKGTEVEITPEMIEAGMLEISSYNTDFETMEEAVARIFIAMIEACNGSAKERGQVDGL